VHESKKILTKKERQIFGWLRGKFRFIEQFDV
jgi:hypothetical protein